MSEDVPDLKEWAAQIAARYMGVDRAEAVGEPNGSAAFDSAVSLS